MPRFPDGASYDGGQAASATNRANALQFYAPLLPIVRELHRRGLSNRAIARELDQRQIKTRNQMGGWNPVQVKRVLIRAGIVPEAAPGPANEPAADLASCA